MVRTHLPRRWTILFLLGFILVLSLPMSITHAAELVVNGGFETGDFTGWTPGDNGVGSFWPWVVSPAGATTFGFTSSPASGTFDALNGFDGNAGLRIFLYQDVPIPANNFAALFFQYRARWHFCSGCGSFGTGATQPRTLTVTIQDTAGTPLRIVHTFSTGVGNFDADSDSGWVSVSTNLSAFAGQTIRLYFEEYIPETATGWGMIEFDSVSIQASRTPIAVTDKGPLPPNFTDGRINRYDTGACVAIYPVNYGDGQGLHIYQIDEKSQGHLVIVATGPMLAALPAKPEKNTLIAQSKDKKIALYKLDTGEFQVNCRKDADAKYDVTIFLAPYRDTHYYKKDWNIYDVLK